ncbi:hypothetical protein Btru_048171 [Bulinus truncatus]|nr:hypothetical protein Btru_048171 [Bulinus truncatus]
MTQIACKNVTLVTLTFSDLCLHQGTQTTPELDHTTYSPVVRGCSQHNDPVAPGPTRNRNSSHIIGQLGVAAMGPGY